MNFFQKGFNSKGRTDNVIRNVNVSLICQFINTIMGFVSRSIFIKLLGETYLGVNGIFGNILTILNFAELGIGTAIVYNLYKPLKEHDEAGVGVLVNFYKKAYFVIGLIITVAGLLLAPFLNYLIKDQPDVKESIYLLYILFLASTVVTYFNAHKKSLLGADQKGHINNIYHQVVHTFQIVMQIVVLLLTHNYILYLLIQIFSNVLENILIARQTDKLYPFLKKYKKTKLEKNLFDSIKKDVGALTIYKLNHAVLHGTDNVLIASIVKNGVQVVGKYANYTLISETINMILGIVTNTLTPSIGNLNAETDIKKKESVFNTTLFVCAWLYGFACTGIMALSEQFLSVWVGKEFALGSLTVFSIALQLYVRQVHYAAYTYRVTTGLFVQSKYVPFLTTIVNLGLSIYLGKIWGLFGILLATSIARIVTIGISDPLLVYKHVFKKSPFTYYLRYGIYTALVVLCYFAANFVIGFIRIDGWLGFILCVLVFSIVFNAIFMAFSFKTNEFRYVKNVALKFIKKIIKR